MDVKTKLGLNTRQSMALSFILRVATRNRKIVEVGFVRVTIIKKHHCHLNYRQR